MKPISSHSRISGIFTWCYRRQNDLRDAPRSRLPLPCLFASIANVWPISEHAIRGIASGLCISPQNEGVGLQYCNIADWTYKRVLSYLS